MFCFASIQLRPISDYDMLTVGFFFWLHAAKVRSSCFFFPALPDESVTLSVNSGMRMKMRSKFPRQRTRKHNKKPNQHHKPNPKNKNPSAKPVVPREMQTR